MAMFRSAALTLVAGSEVRSSSPDVFLRFGQGGIPLWKSTNQEIAFPYPLAVFIILAVLLGVILTRTRFGRYVYAIGGNERSAIYSAINVSRIKLWTYIISGLACGIAALMLASRLNSVSSSQAGMLYELDAIAAVVIGGTRLQGGRGNIIGTVIGVLLLGVIGNMLVMLNVSPFLQGLVKGVIIILAALAQRTGQRGE
jgi:ribose transport system permease protein